MSVIVIKNLQEKALEVRDFSKTILRHAQDNTLDWMFACGGKGRCTTCKVVVLKGLENLEPKTPAELRFEKLGQLFKNERLACQTKVKGDITVQIPEEGKLPHIRYSD
jgi:ferredoxin, 2Fe-2S